MVLCFAYIAYLVFACIYYPIPELRFVACCYICAYVCRICWPVKYFKRLALQRSVHNVSAS
jgi:hypothetical protein